MTRSLRMRERLRPSDISPTLRCSQNRMDTSKSKAPVSQLMNAEVNSVVVIAVLAPNYTLQVRICECHA